MTINDFGGYKPAFRWNAETGELACVETDEIFEKQRHPIDLNSSASTVVFDMLRRERGLGHIEQGVYEMLLAPVGQEVPPLPPGEDPSDFKVAIGLDVWNPKFGLMRLETTGAYFRAAVARIWKEYAVYEEACQGLLPVVRVTGSREVSPPRFPNKIYHSPIMGIVGWLPREKIPEFACQEPTVPLPVLAAGDVQIATALRAKLEGPKTPSSETPKRPRRSDFVKDLPDDGVGDL